MPTSRHKYKRAVIIVLFAAVLFYYGSVTPCISREGIVF
jgi:hypothetical protein